MCIPAACTSALIFVQLAFWLFEPYLGSLYCCYPVNIHLLCCVFFVCLAFNMLFCRSMCINTSSAARYLPTKGFVSRLLSE